MPDTLTVPVTFPASTPDEDTLARLADFQRRAAVACCFWCRTQTDGVYKPGDVQAARRGQDGHWFHVQILYKEKSKLIPCHASAIWNLPLVEEERLPL